MKPTTTWILIADGARARVVQNNGPGKGIEVLDGLTFEGDHASSSEIMADKPGRTFDSVGSSRHAMEPTSDPHAALKVQFINQVIGILESRFEQYDRLILVAPPETLGLLRKSLSPAVVDKVTGELGKDLTQLSNTQLPAHLSNLLPL